MNNPISDERDDFEVEQERPSITDEDLTADADSDVEAETDEPEETEAEAEESEDMGPDESEEEFESEDRTDETVEIGQSDDITTSSVLEAVLFATDEPVTPAKLAEILGAGGVKQVREHIEELNEKYEQMNCAFRIEALAGGYQMLTQSKFNPWLSKLIKVRSETKLSPAALETLAIIAYKQPVLRVDVEAIRGVGAGEMIRQLTEKGLVKIVGRAEELGRPLLYGTTKRFLEVFGLNSLEDLPTAEDLKKPDESANPEP